MNLQFKQQKLNGFEYWVCLVDSKVIATAFSLCGVRSKVLQLIKHKNWS